MKPLYAHILPHVTILQEREYIEDGWKIKITTESIQLWEIPSCGGNERYIEEFSTIQDACKAALELH